MKVPSRETSRLMQGESFCGGLSAEEHARCNFRGQLKVMFTIVLLLVGPPARVKGDDRAKVTADLLHKRNVLPETYPGNALKDSAAVSKG